MVVVGEKMDSILVSALRTQRRVVWALMLRETKTLFGKHKLGYLWALINASFTICIFWVLRELGGFTPPAGMSTPVFLIGGFIPWFIFSETVSAGMNSVSGNRALLAYPQVFVVDILVARALLQGAMYFCVMVFLLLIASLTDYAVPLHDPAAMLFSLILALLLGFGTGAIASSLNQILPTTRLVVPMLLRVLFFTSGLFFSVEFAPAYVRKILFYNPLSHLIALQRNGLSEGYESQFIFLPYVIGFVLLILTLGLLLERYSRQFISEGS
jgi:capsular polysaccharide transport system permease protein